MFFLCSKNPLATFSQPFDHHLSNNGMKVQSWTFEMIISITSFTPTSFISHSIPTTSREYSHLLISMCVHVYVCMLGLSIDEWEVNAKQGRPNLMTTQPNKNKLLLHDLHLEWRAGKDRNRKSGKTSPWQWGQHEMSSAPPLMISNGNLYTQGDVFLSVHKNVCQREMEQSTAWPRETKQIRWVHNKKPLLTTNTGPPEYLRELSCVRSPFMR